MLADKLASGRGWAAVGVLAAAWAVGCTVPAYVPEDTDASGTDSDEPAVDSDTDLPVDTDPPDTLEPQETGWPEDDTTGQGGGGNLPPLGCHPFMPVTDAGWRLVYDAQYRNARNGREVHEGMGLVPLPNWLDVTGHTEAYGWTTTITNAGDADSVNEFYALCDVDGPGLFEVGWERAIETSLLGPFGRTTIYLRADARNERQMLAGESDVLGGYPSWQQNMRFDLTQIGGTIGGPDTAEWINNGEYVGVGTETVTTGAGTFQDAFHLQVIYTESRQDDPGGLQDLFFGVWEGLLQSVFGFANGAASVTAQADRWYVRGIGLVKETTIDVNTGDILSQKNLASCRGLPACP